MSGALLMIQIQLRQRDNLAILFVTMIEIVYAFGVMLIASEMGQRMNVEFDECSQMVDQFDWYLFPTKVQRMLPLILNFTQQPFVVRCFGSSACDRNTFKSASVTILNTILHQLFVMIQFN